MAYSQIASIYKIQNNFKKSLAYHKLYANYKDSLAIEQNLKAKERYNFFKKTTQRNNTIKNLEIKNKLQEIQSTKEQSNRIGLLVFTALILLLLALAINRNRLKQRAIKKIEEKNEENKLLIREIHHRVKNNLQIISSLLGAKITTNIYDENTKHILQESQNKIKSMAIIHQNLYKGNQFTKVVVNKYIEELITQIKRNIIKKSDVIVFDLNIEPQEIQIGLAVPLGLILNELINNCYKYEFSNKKEKEKKISIRFKKLKNTSKYVLVVEYKGKTTQNDLDIKQPPNLGLQLVYELTDQLQGEVNITQDKLTCFKITFKKDEYY